MSDAPFPWQTDQWHRLSRARADGRSAHALLLTAPSGTGLEAFADAWSRALLCMRPGNDGRACGGCPSCEQMDAGTCPDFVRVVPEETGKAIGVDAVRALIERLALTAGNRGKVAVIDPADAMTLAAANSLLKTLEEPSGDCTIVLVSTRPSRLPGTVRSRCRKVAFGLPDPAAGLAWLSERDVPRPEHWLRLAGGAPLLAGQLAEAESDGEYLVEGLLDTLERGSVPLSLVGQAGGQSLDASLPVLTTVVADLVRLRVAAPDAGRLQHPAHAARMARIAARLDARLLFHYLDQLNRAMPGPSSSLRADMQVQGLLADAAALGRTGTNQGG